MGEFTVFYCDRGKDVETLDCESCRTSVPASELRPCTFELRGAKTGQTCGKMICVGCQDRKRRVLCPPHRRLIDKEKRL